MPKERRHIKSYPNVPPIDKGGLISNFGKDILKFVRNQTLEIWTNSPLKKYVNAGGHQSLNLLLIKPLKIASKLSLEELTRKSSHQELLLFTTLSPATIFQNCWRASR